LWVGVLVGLVVVVGVWVWGGVVGVLVWVLWGGLGLVVGWGLVWWWYASPAVERAERVRTGHPATLAGANIQPS
jgi:hypothetical protein